ncbi:HPr(Ser) kinase/phosphatase [Mycoplasmopsis hyopharyngis]|uniref:HPr(Ser) kinase/phosphatase n=1 Tax=Mycoplasmopsis hyopharyngis TaxID=29558 RepID=UPI0038737A8E
MKSQKNKINVKKIISKFDLELVNTDIENLDYKDIKMPAIKRLGLELANAIENDRYTQNIVCWGTSESKYFGKLGKEKSIQTLERVLSIKPPLLILSNGMDALPKKWILSVADKYRIPLVFANNSTAQISTTIGTYLSDSFSIEEQIHGCLTIVGGVGVLIVGESGVGKSEATLELIQKGHLFVADDAVLIRHSGASFLGRSPEITKNFLEVRGIGIIDVKYTYGIRSVIDTARVDLVIELVNKEKLNTLDRIGMNYLKYKILDGYVNMIQIPVKDGSSVGSLIEAAVSTFLSRKDGVDILKELSIRNQEPKGGNND